MMGTDIQASEGGQGDDERRRPLDHVERWGNTTLRFWRSVLAGTAQKVIVLILSTSIAAGAFGGASAVQGGVQVILLALGAASVLISCTILVTSRFVRSRQTQQQQLESQQAENVALREKVTSLEEAEGVNLQLRVLAETELDMALAKIDGLEVIVASIPKSTDYAGVNHDIAKGLAYLFEHPDCFPQTVAVWIEGRCLAPAAEVLAQGLAVEGDVRPRVELALVQTGPAGYTVTHAPDGQAVMTEGTQWLEPQRALDEVAARKARHAFHRDGHRVLPLSDRVHLVALSDAPLGEDELTFLLLHVDYINLSIVTLLSLGMS